MAALVGERAADGPYEAVTCALPSNSETELLSSLARSREHWNQFMQRVVNLERFLIHCTARYIHFEVNEHDIRRTRIRLNTSAICGKITPRLILPRSTNSGL
jgi:hypothetical protein